MKKISAVLLVLVLVGSVAFAGFTGSADATFKVDLDGGSYGFANNKEFDIELTFHEELAGAKGEGDIYAEISASFSFGYEIDETSTLDESNIVVEADIDVAKIAGEKWSVSILKALAAPNYAKSAVDFDADGKAQDYLASKHVEAKAGVTVEYDGYKVGISVPYTLNNFKTPTNYFMGAVETKTFEVADGLKLTFGAAGQLVKPADNAASLSAKGEFEVADEYSAKAAVDAIYDNSEIILEAAAGFALVDPKVTLDVYYASKGQAGTKVYTDPLMKNILSAKASTTIEGLTLTISGKNLLNTGVLGLTASYKASDAITVGANGGYTLKGADMGYWSAGGDVTYTAEDFKLKVDGKFEHKAANSLKANVTVSSTTLVDGATLSLAYNGGNYLATPVGIGSVTAKALIEF